MIQEFNLYQKLPILSYEALDSPKVFIGCCIKSQYDEERIHIEDKFEPKRIDHCGRYLYGSLIEPFGKYEDALKEFYKIKSIDLSFLSMYIIFPCLIMFWILAKWRVISVNIG